MESLGKKSPPKSTAKKWPAELNKGTESVEDDGRSCRPKYAENGMVVNTLGISDRRRDQRSITREVGISFRAVQTVFTDILGMSKVSAIWGLRMLTYDQKRTWLDISRYLLSCYEDDHSDFIERVVTEDETWVHHFDPDSKMQNNNGSTLAHPLLRNLRGFIQRER